MGGSNTSLTLTQHPDLIIKTDDQQDPSLFAQLMSKAAEPNQSFHKAMAVALDPTPTTPVTAEDALIIQAKMQEIDRQYDDDHIEPSGQNFDTDNKQLSLFEAQAYFEAQKKSLEIDVELAGFDVTAARREWEKAAAETDDTTQLQPLSEKQFEAETTLFGHERALARAETALSHLDDIFLAADIGILQDTNSN